MRAKSMEASWMNNMRYWGSDPQRSKGWIDYLVGQYTSKERKYHSLNHIAFMLELAKKNKGQIKNWTAFYLAIWFHDVIQNRFQMNETLSARKCVEAIDDLNLSENAEEAIGLILATKHHDKSSSDDAKLFIDLDLAILGSPRHEYQQYAQQCRAEYKLPDYLYRNGRAKVLKRFLQREHIYKTSVFRKKLENQARSNLEWEIEAIEIGVTV